MTFTEQYMNAMLGGRMLDFKHIDNLLEAFEVDLTDISEEDLKAFVSVNHVLQHIFEMALQTACKEIDICKSMIVYSIEANSLASYLAIWDDNSFWNTVHNYRELLETLEKIKLEKEQNNDANYKDYDEYQ